MKILNCVEYKDSVCIITDYCKTSLAWFVRTRGNEKDSCKGCVFSKRQLCPVDPGTCKRDGHFKRVRDGDLMIREDGKKFKAYQKDSYNIIPIPMDI